MSLWKKDSMNPTPSEDQPTSPVPVSSNQALNFPEALDAILMGAKVTKEDWDDEDIYGFMSTVAYAAGNNDQLMIHRNGKDHQWILSKGDIEGEDFFVIN